MEQQMADLVNLPKEDGNTLRLVVLNCFGAARLWLFNIKDEPMLGSW